MFLLLYINNSIYIILEKGSDTNVKERERQNKDKTFGLYSKTLTNNTIQLLTEDITSVTLREFEPANFRAFANARIRAFE